MKRSASRDLRVYAEALDGSVYHFRTKEGLECDAVVIHLRNGSYGLVEVKLGGDRLMKGAHTLKIVAGKIDTTKMKEPSFLMVLTGTSLMPTSARTRVCGTHHSAEE